MSDNNWVPTWNDNKSYRVRHVLILVEYNIKQHYGIEHMPMYAFPTITNMKKYYKTTDLKYTTAIYDS